MKGIAFAVALLLARPAHAEEPTAADVQGAPLPGDESGRTDPQDHGASTWRKVGRGLLYVPRAIVEAIFAPVRVSLWSYGRYNLREMYLETFFNASRTTGIYPTATFETGFGFNVGAKIVQNGIIRPQDTADLLGTVGGQYRGQVAFNVKTTDRKRERYELRAGFLYERRPKDRYFGIGDDEEMPEVRYRKRVTRAVAIADVRVVNKFYLRGSGALASINYGNSEEGFPIEIVYPDEITGFEGVDQGYVELEARYDSRRNANRWEPRSVPATGWLLSGYSGRVIGLEESSSFWNYGVDLQRFIRLGKGPRMISARLWGESVSGSYDEVPFSQLPVLGGGQLLRGYDTDRFRDRVAVVAQLGYHWDLSAVVGASLFADVGRVYPAIDEIDFDGLRLGYGLAIETHTRSSFVLRGSIASSIDGGLHVFLAFDPVYTVGERVLRR